VFLFQEEFFMGFVIENITVITWDDDELKVMKDAVVET